MVYAPCMRMRVGVYEQTWGAYRPLVVIGPDVHVSVGGFDLYGVVKGEGLFGGDDLDFDVAVLLHCQ